MHRRNLSSRESIEAQLVFGASIAYERVAIIEEVDWPNWVGRIGSWLSRTEAPRNNAVALGNKLYFPKLLLTDNSADPVGSLNDMAWLIHELTHVWQYQHFWLAYLPQVMWAHIRNGSETYNYGLKRGLDGAFERGERLEDFNREQQGEIARHYYCRLKQGQDVSVWLPFIAEFQTSTSSTPL
ncbi:MAG: hypothetical protein E3J30_05695 [Anaerolineales bacterium]|nr:MAG: hypothetical protein E3J30_05695 [Anaerolineales bacterium]